MDRRLLGRWQLVLRCQLVRRRDSGQHEFSDQSADIRAALGGAGTFDWKTDGDSRDRMQAGVGCVFALGTSARVNVGCQADFGADDYHSHLVSVQAGCRF